ncbi:hypothetical protein GCM10027592_27640 [Spirosoma flavus]
MKRRVLLPFLIGYFWVFPLLRSLAQPGVTMYVNGRNIYSAVGEKVVFRGVNEMFVYSSDKQGVTTLPQIAQTGANVVRICWNTSGSASDLDALLGNSIANKIIPIVQLDNSTGNLYNLQTCLDYWKRSDVMTAMNKYKKWVLLNIANEAGDNYTTDSQFQTAYTDAVSQLRTAGYTLPLVIDAPGYGQNENVIINTWNSLQQSDPQHNLVFSVHPYWKDSNTQTLQNRFTNLFNAVVSQNIPFIIGEGPQQTGYDCSTSIPYSWVLQQCQANQIGWMVWTWGKVQDGTSNCGTTFDVTTNGNYGSWSNTWGQAIAVSDPNSIQNTSVRPPSILGNVTPDTQPPTTPTNVVVSNVTSTGATLSWTASTDNLGVAGYAIYAGTTLLASTPNTSITLGLTCNMPYSNVTVKAKDGAGNTSSASNAVSFTTGACPAGELVYGDALNTNWEDWTWSAYRNFANTSPVKEGSKSIRVDYGGYGGFSVRRNSPITPSAGMVIKFWVYSSVANNLKVYTQADDSGGYSQMMNFTTDANQWKEITVTMATLGNPSAIKRINIQEDAGNSPAIFYDYIRFDTGTSTPDTQAPSTPTNLAASGITPTGLTLNWTASTDNVGVTAYQVFQGATLLNGNVTGTTYAVSGLSCGTAYAFTVKARDAAGNVSTVSNTANATTSTCPANELVIYNDAVGTDWQDWSWNTSNNFSTTSPVQVGSNSAKVDYYAWGGFSLRKGNALTTNSNTLLKFWVRSTGSQPIKVYTNNADSGGEASGYTFTPTANQWQEISLTMSQLGNPTQIKRLNFQNYHNNNITVYYDHIRLVSVSGGRESAELLEGVSTPGVYPNPSDGLITVTYYVQKSQPVQIQVVNASGQTLHRQDEQAQTGENRFKIDMRDRPAGLYLIRLQSSGEVEVRKVLIQR